MEQWSFIVLNLFQYLRSRWMINDAKIGVECSIEFLAQPLDTREYSHDKLEL